MLVLVLVIAIFAYVALYYVWLYSQDAIMAHLGPLQTLARIARVPDEVGFKILHGLIVLTLLYLVADMVVSKLRGKRKSKRKH